MEARLQQFCLNTEQIEQLIYRCQLEMTHRQQQTLRIRQSYTDCTNILLQMAIKVGSNISEFKLINKLVDLSFKKLIQVIQFYSRKSKSQNNYDFQKQNKDEQQEWTTIAFGDSLIDKNGNLIKHTNKNTKRKNIYEELTSDSYNLIDRLKQNTQQKIQSLNTHIITNELQELNTYFDHCKNNFMKFFIQQNKQIDQIWKRSKQDYEPTIQLMELWKVKLECQLDELKAKMSGLQKQLTKKIDQIRILKQKLEAYNIDTRQHATQTPGLYDYRILELNQQQRLIQLESKRLFDLITSYDGMLKEQFKMDQSKYKRIRQQMMKSMDKIKKLELENTQMKEEFQKQNDTNNHDLYNDQTFELLKELRSMPAFQREMYNSAIVKFINAIKKMSKSSMNEEMVISLGLEGQTIDLRIDKKMFININEEQKNIIQQIHRRRSKIIQFDIGKMQETLESFKKKSDASDHFSPSTPPDELEFLSKGKGKRFNKMKSLELKGKRIFVGKNQKLDNSRQNTSPKNIIASNLKEVIEVQIDQKNDDKESRGSNSLIHSTHKQYTKKDTDQETTYGIASRNQSQKGSKRSLLGTNKNLKPSTSRQKSSRSNRTPQHKNHLKSYQKKSSINRTIRNSIIIQQPMHENIRTEPVNHSSKQANVCSSVSVQTDQLELVCLACGNLFELINNKQATPFYNISNNVNNINNNINNNIDNNINNKIKNSNINNKQIEAINLKQLKVHKILSPKLKQQGRTSRSKQTRIWTPTVPENQEQSPISQVLRKRQNQKPPISSKFILNKLNESSIQKKAQNIHKLSLNVESLGTSHLDYSSSFNSPVRKSTKQPIRKLRNSQFQKKSQMQAKLFDRTNTKEIRRSNFSKNFQGNQLSHFHSLLEDSLNQWRSHEDSGLLENLYQVKQCSSVQLIVEKFKQLHQNKCKQSNCNHLSRFYQSLKRMEKSNLPRKSPMPLKTLKIQRIDHN